MITTKRIVRYMPPVSSMSGKFDDAATVAGKGQQFYVGHYRKYRTGQETRYFAFRSKEMAFSSDSTQSEVLKWRAKFKRVAAAARTRMADASKMAKDKIAFNAQTKYATLYGYIFKQEWDADEE